jgi:hypothetical protein
MGVTVRRLPEEKQQHEQGRPENSPNTQSGTELASCEIVASAGRAEPPEVPTHSNALRSIHPVVPLGKVT